MTVLEYLTHPRSKNDPQHLYIDTPSGPRKVLQIVFLADSAVGFKVTFATTDGSTSFLHTGANTELLGNP